MRVIRIGGKEIGKIAKDSKVRKDVVNGLCSNVT